MALQTKVANKLRHAFFLLLELAKKGNNVLTLGTRVGVCFRSGRMDAVPSN